MTFAEHYLVDPAQFPGALGERHWGAESLTLGLAGRAFRVEGLGENQQEQLRSRFRGYCLDAEPSEPVVLRVLRGDATCFLPQPSGVWVYSLDLDHRDESVAWAGVREAGVLELVPAFSASMWTVEGAGNIFARAVENVLRLIVAYALLEAGGALFHGACVVDDGKAVLFPGVSGSGKSTSSRIAAHEGRTVLSDDIVGVVASATGYEAVALPFGSEFRFPGPWDARFPVRAMCRLVKGETILVNDLSRAEALGLALACTPYVNHDPARTERLFGNLLHLIRSVRLRTLCFPKDGPIWAALPPGAL
ncbi:MAG TPA: hypothetical protein PLS53_01575 [Thermoanaerobaculaceae bacterium]|nr:hypothetical protein [Thermoanaerobaculaceae bacterium]HPS76825.1 hypothetical protein [Thermoanaerobaculaceae bacterium]